MAGRLANGVWGSVAELESISRKRTDSSLSAALGSASNSTAGGVKSWRGCFTMRAVEVAT